MTADERDIAIYLKTWPHTFVSAKEIARKVGGKERYSKDRGWALPILAQMLRNGILETDYFGHYRLKPITNRKKRKQTFVSPQFMKILKNSGREFEGISSGANGEEELFVIADEEDKSEASPIKVITPQTAGKVK